MISVSSIKNALSTTNHIPAYSGDMDLNAHLKPYFEQALKTAVKPAAVLIPLIARENGLHVLLTRRTEHLQHHAGQISFPGGKVEKNDKGFIDTALRETHEEIGIDRSKIEILGRIPQYSTRTGFIIEPVVGLITPPFEMTLCAHEVAHTLEVPLSFFMDQQNCSIYSKELQGAYAGHEAHFYHFEYKSEVIWGATAGMIVGLRDIVQMDLAASSSPKFNNNL